MREKEFHNKVTWITFILSVLVVMVHAYNADLYIRPGAGGVFAIGLERLQSLISAAMPTVSVPGFFMISAYLFFRDVSFKNISGKIRRRVGSVLVPYIAWTSLYYVFFVAAGSFPALWGMLGRGSVEFSLAGLSDAIINYTYNPILWYLKQLIILIAMTPVLYALVSRVWLAAAALAFTFVLAGRGTIIPVLNLDALFYYFSGAFLAVYGRTWVEGVYDDGKKGKLKQALLVVFGTAAAVFLYWAAGRYSSIFMLVLFAVVSPATLWIALPERLPDAKSYMGFGLFLYAFHFLPVRTINKLGALLLPRNAVTAAVVYVLMPVLVVILTWAIAVFLKKYMPPLWKLLSGGR